MEIRKLIEQGEDVARRFTQTNAYTTRFISGEPYQDWLSLATSFLQQNYPGNEETIRFGKIAQNANGHGESKYQSLIAILRAFEKLPPQPIRKDIFVMLKEILENFKNFDVAIKKRYGERTTIIIRDEHDLQDALYAILKLFVDDIKKEEYVPSYAGGKSRTDFFMPDHKLIIEAKMTRTTLKDKQVGEELIIDFTRYKELGKADCLICFVYDRDTHLDNRTGLINDLERLSDDKMQMKVFITS